VLAARVHFIGVEMHHKLTDRTVHIQETEGDDSAAHLANQHCLFTLQRIGLVAFRYAKN
jgi:hypothetical protein